MKSISTAFFLIPLFFISINAQYKLDTLTSKQVGPGVTYLKLKEPIAPNIIYVMEIDLKNPYIKMETVKAKDLKVGLEKPSVMARQADSAGHHVIGIVNSDFFINSEPDNMQVIKGEITRRQRSGYSAVGFDTSNHYMLAYPAFKGVLYANKTATSIYGVDEARGTNQIIMYNSYHGSSTGTQTAGTEATISPINGWAVNDTVLCIVKKVAATTGNTPINKRELVLSGQGSGATFLDQNVKVGDTVKVIVEVSTGPKKITELVGGRPIFYKNGLIDSSITTISVVAVRNPRTIVGFSKDSSKCYVMVVDGRQTFSVGMDIWEMAKLMKTLNINNAMNFDGGGSAIMVIEGNTLNSPSDGAERSVSNGLIIVSKAPEASIKSITLAPKTLKIFRGESFAFSLTGRDEYDAQIPLISSKIKYTCGTNLGAVAAGGKFTAAKQADSGYVFVSYNDLKDSCFVRIQDVKFCRISPKNIVTDSTAKIQFLMDAFDADSLAHSVPTAEYKWVSSNTQAGTINSNGLFSGLNEGATLIIATYKNLSDTAKVKIEIGKGSQLFSPMESLSGWTISGTNFDSLSLSLSTVEKSQGNASFKVDFKYNYNSSLLNTIFLNTDLPVYGIPDSVFIDVKSNGLKNKLYYRFADDNNEFFRAQGKKYLDNSLIFDRIPAPIKGLVPVETNSVLNFPLTLKRIEIQLATGLTEGQLVNGTIYFDNLIIKYPSSVTSVFDGKNTPADFNLLQNYPNPFNPVTTISFNITEAGFVKLIVFDALGREVNKLINKELTSGSHKVYFNASNLTSGVYFYRLQCNDKSLVNKMMVLK